MLHQLVFYFGAYSKKGRNLAKRKPSPTLSKNDDVAFGFDNPALSKFKDTLGKIESASDYSVRGGFNNHYLGKYQMGKAALEDVGVGYSKEEQEEFLADPAKQEKAFEEFTKQNHEYLETGESEKDGFGTGALKYIKEVARALG